MSDLRPATVIHPVALDQLDAIRRRQLEIANMLYGGVEETIEEIFGRSDDDDNERIYPSLTSLSMLVDGEGRPAFDSWEYMGDRGTIFAAGTDQVVAEMIQGGLECSDPELKARLRGRSYLASSSST